jgi:unsaturated rhamnogalacturonyl hydrolase
MQSLARLLTRVNNRSRSRNLCHRGAYLLPIVFCALGALPSCAQTIPWSERVANATIQRRLDGQLASPSLRHWNEETGFLLEGMDAAWYNTASGDYFRYVEETVDAYLSAGGAEADENLKAEPLAVAMLGRQLLLLYRVTLDPKYYEAARLLRQQLVSSCSGVSAGPARARSDGQERPCMAEPFLAEYASVFQEPQDFAGIARDLVQWEEDYRLLPARRANVGSTDSYLRDLAWFAVALVDSLSYYPRDEAGRAQLMAILNRTTAEIALYQDRATGLWVTALAPPAELQQPVEPSVDCLFVYALLKGARLGYLPAQSSADAKRAWQGIFRHFVEVDGSGTITPASTGLRGAGALLLAATEIDLASTATLGHGDTVLLDAWYNSQQRRNAAGQMDYFHYKWSDFSDSGYSLFGHMVRSYGMETDTLHSAPTAERLRKAQFYVIVSPDIPVKNPNPHYMTEQEADVIAAWVKQGGVLVLMENDPPNADVTHINLLANRFGIHFDDVLTHHIIGEQVEPGRIATEDNGPLFHQAHALYMKDTCAISIQRPAVTLLRDGSGIVMAAAKYGRGTVFANVDPWLYNEYTDGRNNPKIYGQFDNFAGGKELVRWLLQQRPRIGDATGAR